MMLRLGSQFKISRASSYAVKPVIEENSGKKKPGYFSCMGGVKSLIPGEDQGKVGEGQQRSGEVVGFL